MCQNAKEKGQIKILASDATLNFTIEAGWLDKADADAVKENIAKKLKK